MKTESVSNTPSLRPLRPAWIEVNLAQLRRNFDLINLDKPNALGLLSVVVAASTPAISLSPLPLSPFEPADALAEPTRPLLRLSVT